MNHLTLTDYELSVRRAWPHQRVLPAYLRGLPSAVWMAAMRPRRRHAP